MAKRSYQQHGLTQAKRLLNEYGSRAIDARTRAGRALADWTQAIEEDLGGEEAISAQQRALLELAVRTKNFLDGVNAWLLSQGREPINKKEKRLWPIVRERMALSDSLARYLTALGLEKRAAEGTDLTEYVRERYGSGTE
jgi:hypothetical protein